MTPEEFQKLERGVVLISPLGSEIVVRKVTREREFPIYGKLVVARAYMFGGCVVNYKNFHNWQRKGVKP